MPFKVEAKLEGVEQAIAALKALPAKLARRALRQAVAAGTRRLAREAKQLAPMRTKLLRKSLGSKVKAYPSGAVVGIVGVRTGFRQQVGVAKIDSRRGTKYPRKAGDPVYGNPAKYLHLVELGTTRSKASGFLSRAIRVTGAAVRAAIAESVAKALQREAGK